MSEWQPIETAPKDGTVILLYGDGKMGTAWWVNYRPHNDYAMWRDHGDLGACGLDPFEPTHWMPMPDPPVVTKNA